MNIINNYLRIHSWNYQTVFFILFFVFLSFSIFIFSCESEYTSDFHSNFQLFNQLMYQLFYVTRFFFNLEYTNRQAHTGNKTQYRESLSLLAQFNLVLQLRKLEMLMLFSTQALVRKKNEKTEKTLLLCR